MATVKVKLRKSTVAGKAGRIFYQISHHGEVQQLSTRFRLQPEEWDGASGRIVAPNGDPVSAVLQFAQAQIDNDIKQLRQIIHTLTAGRRAFTVRDIAEAFRAPTNRITMVEYLEEQIALLQAEKRLGTARNYLRALQSLRQFLNGAELPIASFDERIVQAYSCWLQRRGISRNSRSFYMRILRSVYNKAVRQQIVEQSYPFRHTYTGVDRTVKRAIPEELIRRLRHADLTHRPALALARDLFIFSYCMRGISFIDLAYLQKEDLKGEVIHYTRRKTGQRLSVRLEPCMLEIIRRYGCQTSGSPYLFPVLRSDDPLTAYAQYQVALTCYNQRLKRLSQLLQFDVKLSSYTARHSWATTARNRNVPISVISAGMGHSSEKTTQIYLAALEGSVIDQANRRIVALLG